MIQIPAHLKKDPVIRWLVVIALVLITALVMFHLAIYRPMSEAAKEAEVELANLERAFAYQHALSEQYERALELRPILADLSEKVRNRFESVAYSALLESAVRDSGVTLVSQSYADENRRSKYGYVIVKARVVSDYASVKQFISMVVGGDFYTVLNKGRFEAKGHWITADLEFQVRSIHRGERTNG
ncbi:MAG: hypothetical protein MI794_16780 [Pseudomonadales bacterium]|nr:hypothetical protein [Pseudomonadales bacterium]